MDRIYEIANKPRKAHVFYGAWLSIDQASGGFFLIQGEPHRMVFQSSLLRRLHEAPYSARREQGLIWRVLLRWASPQKTCFSVISEGVFNTIQISVPHTSRAVLFLFLSWAVAPLRQDGNCNISRGAILHFTFPGVQGAQRAGIKRGGPAPMGIPSQNLFPYRFWKAF